MTRKLNSKRGHALLGLAVPLLVGCAKTHVVVEAKSLSAPDALHYVLPRTVLKVTSNVSVSTIGSPVCPSSDAIEMGVAMPALKPPSATQGGKYFTLHSIEVEVASEADPDARFAIDLASTGGSQLNVTFDPRGVMTKAQSEASDETLPAILGIGQSVLDIGLSAAFGAAATELDKPPSTSPSTATYCKQARATLGRLRETIAELYGSGSAGDTKEVLEIKLAKLSALEKKAEAVFNGVLPGSPKKIVCEVRPRPESQSGGSIRLFGYSGLVGLLPMPAPAPAAPTPAAPATASAAAATAPAAAATAPAAPATAPAAPATATAAPATATAPAAPATAPHALAADVSCDFPPDLVIDPGAHVTGTDADKLEAAYDVVLSAQLVDGVLPSEPVDRRPSAEGKRSFRYRVPRFADVFAEEHTSDTPNVYRYRGDKQRVAIAQLGQIRSLPVFEVGGSATLSVTLDPASGALLELAAKEKSVDLGAAAGTAGKMVTTTLGAVRDADLKDLQRKQALLEAQVAIQAAEKALNP